MEGRKDERVDDADKSSRPFGTRALRSSAVNDERMDDGHLPIIARVEDVEFSSWRRFGDGAREGFSRSRPAAGVGIGEVSGCRERNYLDTSLTR